MKRPLILVMISVVTLVLLGITWVAFISTGTQFAPPPLPVPNGYDQLLEAAEKVAPRTNLYPDMDEVELAIVANQNKPALKLLINALQKDIGVPIDWAIDPSVGVQRDMDNLQAIRILARALTVELRSNLANGMSKEAVVSGSQIIQLGNECYRGGLIVDLLVGLAIQQASINELKQVVIQYPEKRTDIITTLLPLLATGEAVEVIIQRETSYIHSATRGYMGFVVRANSEEMLEPPVRITRQTELQTTAQQRLFLLHLAVNEYYDQHGSWPDQLSELAPNFLPAIFLDPYSNTNFVYRVEEGGYRLYSVGLNKKDDGGVGDATGFGQDFVDDLVPEPAETTER